MPETLLESPMTDEQPKTISVKLRVKAVKAARIVSSYRDVTITDLLSDIVEPILAKMEQDEVAKRQRLLKKKSVEEP